MSDSATNPNVRQIDFAAINALGPDERFVQKLLDVASGARNCTISCIRTHVGGGSPEGLHTHEVDQIFYIVSGTMQIEIEGEKFAVGPGSIVQFSAGIPHQNWNEGPEPTVHLNICAPVPDPGKPFATGCSEVRVSARNQLVGTIQAIEVGAVTSIVTLQLDGGEKLVSSITRESVEILGLTVGSKAIAVIKSSDVMIGTE